MLRQAKLFAEDMKAKLNLLQGFHLDQVNGRWVKPIPGYYKLNVDGSFQDGKAAYGGLLRNDAGQLIWGFVGYCGFTNALHAELMALKERLSTFHNKNALRVVIESNSSQAVNLVLGFLDESYLMLDLILECKCLH